MAILPTVPSFAADASDSGAIETVTVTAQRRVESAETVGIALTVLSPETLQNRGVTTVNDLQYLVPSFQATPQFGSGQPGFVIRGVGFDDYASNNAPTVGVYIDETAYPIPFMTQGLIFDLQRIEVLRGPQGTLYGRNTTGGAINFITNKPTDSFTAGATFEFGSYDAAKFDTFVSGPIADNLRVRLAGTTDQGGAWQFNRATGESLGDADRGALRLLTDYDATDNLKFELNTHWSIDHSDAAGLYLLTPLSTPQGIIPADTNRSATGWGTSPSFASEIGISPAQKPFRDNEGWGADLKSEYTLPIALLTDIASYEGFDRREYDNFDASPTPNADTYFRSRAAVYADELRLNSLADAPLVWVGGLYYSYEHLNEDYRSGFIDSFGVNADTPYTQTAQTESAFGQVSPRLNDEITVDLGIRIEHERRNLENFNTFGMLPSGFVIPFNAPDQSRSTSYTLPSGVARLNYKPDGDTLFYGSISRGVKSGGFTAYNSTDPNSIGTDAFAPEKLWAYEIGSKTTLADHRLQLNTAAYYYDYTDKQVQSSIVDPVYGQIGKIVNAPKSEIMGLEAEAIWRPLPPLQITQSVGYTRGKFDQFIDVGGVAGAAGSYRPILVDRAGQDLGAPKLTYTGSVSYTWTYQSYAVEPGFDYTYRGRYTSHFGPLYDIGSYWFADAHLSVAPENSWWTATLWGHNIFDRRYDITRNFFVANDNVGLAAEPATVGITISATY